MLISYTVPPTILFAVKSFKIYFCCSNKIMSVCHLFWSISIKFVWAGKQTRGLLYVFCHFIAELQYHRVKILSYLGLKYSECYMGLKYCTNGVKYITIRVKILCYLRLMLYYWGSNTIELDIKYNLFGVKILCYWVYNTLKLGLKYRSIWVKSQW